MRNYFLTACLLFSSFAVFAQAGHIMQGVGAVNMSMGGAATAQPLSIEGALQWNPATLSDFDGKILSISVGGFFSSPELSSSLAAGSMGPGSPAISGTTEDDRGISIMPAMSFVWGKADSKHTFGVSAFGISGFGVTFNEETNLPVDEQGNPNPNWDPNNSNPISYPQSFGGFGHIESDYMLLQIGFAYSYQISEKFSIGLQPTFNYSALELAPNPVSTPDFPPPFGTGKGYPVTDKASAVGFGGQVGVFYDSGGILKLGASYKTKQYFGEFDFDQKYVDGSAAPNVSFKMNYPAILSVGMGLSGGKFDFALDYRYVDYENTEGFAESGWQIAESGDFAGFPTGAVNGFGWKNMSILSIGLQYQATEKLPIRVGYTYSSNPIEDELAFYSIPATAVIENAAQIGLGYTINDKIELNAVYHYGFRGDGASGNLLNPQLITADNPLGKVPGSSVSYDMSTSMIQFNMVYKFGMGSSKSSEPTD
ncbi:MAG: outer membrane protein transport protein [Flavobacteriaceae bacterium]